MSRLRRHNVDEDVQYILYSVPAGLVILESPALPVMEGDNVTLSCRCRVTTSAFNKTADFYKDGLLIESSSTGSLILHSVFTPDEGLYKCKMSVFGESPESRLTVRGEKVLSKEKCSKNPPAQRQPTV